MCEVADIAFYKLTTLMHQNATQCPLPQFSPYPFPKQALVFTCLLYKSLKTLQEKEKLLVTSIFPFPTVFSNLLENFPPFYSNLYLSPTNPFSLEKSKFVVWESNLLKLSALSILNLCCSQSLLFLFMALKSFEIEY